MRLKRVVSLALASVVLAVLTGCDGFFVSPGSIDHINLSSRGFLLKPNDLAVHITATAVKVDGSTEDITATATWTSDTPTVATVDSAGNVTPKAAGTATITAASGKNSATATVIVNPASVASFIASPITVTLRLSQQQLLTPTLTLSDGTVPNVTNLLTWTSADTTIATVNQNGLVTAVSTFNFTGTTNPSTTVTASFSTAAQTESATTNITLSAF